MNDNLKPRKKGQKRTKEEIQKQKETWARKKQIKEIAEELLCKIRDRRSSKTIKEEILEAGVEKALNGDLKAIELILKIIGEMPKDTNKVEIEGNILLEPITGLEVIDET